MLFENNKILSESTSPLPEAKWTERDVQGKSLDSSKDQEVIVGRGQGARVSLNEKYGNRSNCKNLMEHSLRHLL